MAALASPAIRVGMGVAGVAELAAFGGATMLMAAAADATQVRDKGRFLTLDAMRGVAAILVVSIHFVGQYGGHRPALGFLAVDAFFVLSGFVIAHRYDAQIESGKLSFWAFMKRRIQRLAPIYLLGFILGLADQALTHSYVISNTRFAISSATSLIGLPSPVAPALQNFFPVNAPFWSLFFELWVANVAFALFWRTIRGWRLSLLIFVSACCLAALSLQAHTVDGGWAWHTVALGFARVLFSFYVGVALARRHRTRPISISVPAPLVLCALAATLIWPVLPSHLVLSELFAVVVAFPLLTTAATTATHMPARVGALMGDASYALYAIHFPIKDIAGLRFASFFRAHQTPSQIAFIVATSALSLAVAAADERIRKRLFRSADKRTRASGPGQLPGLDARESLT